MQLVGVLRFRPTLGPNPRDRNGIEPAKIRSILRRHPAPRQHRLGAALFQRRVIEKGIGPGRQHFQRQ
ncbi:MAG TPA: hypothetical protein VGD36_17130, partial [Xanthobacteraceae bacterium]